ncbi:MAG TPA: hypothetical protein VKU89_03460 [Solirubrobacteraceae bacterium]|nr:hypothetical protein [Solirubrobacteraceae bacterium]
MGKAQMINSGAGRAIVNPRANLRVKPPAALRSIGSSYRDLSPTREEEVETALAERGPIDGGATPAEPAAHRVQIDAEGVRLSGDLVLPCCAHGVVVFAHGAGSNRLSPRNRPVALALNRAGIGTLRFDLLSPEEALDRANIFDIPLLKQRLLAATGWLAAQARTRDLPLGYFGARTGAAAALLAAAELGARVSAVVSRGGRPDLVLPALEQVTAPTLLIVGGYDWQVLELNREAQEYLRCPNRLSVVPQATHLFEEPGALEEVARLSVDWFAHSMRRPSPALEDTAKAAAHGR